MEEDFIERCILELLEEEEQWEWFIPSRDLPTQMVNQLQDQISLLVQDTAPHADTNVDVVSPHHPLSCHHFKTRARINIDLLCRRTAV